MEGLLSTEPTPSSFHRNKLCTCAVSTRGRRRRDRTEGYTDRQFLLNDRIGNADIARIRRSQMHPLVKVTKVSKTICTTSENQGSLLSVLALTITRNVVFLLLLYYRIFLRGLDLIILKCADVHCHKICSIYVHCCAV